MISNQVAILFFHAILLGVCGSVASWKKLFFFSHVLSHSLLLPPIICLSLGIESEFAIMITSICFACIFAIVNVRLEQMLPSDKDNVLIASSMIFMSVSIILSNMINASANFMSYMIGDVLLTNIHDLFLVVFMALLSIVYFLCNWKKIVIHVVNPSYGALRFGHMKMISNFYIVFYAIVITISTKMFGSLLTSGATTMPSVISVIIAKTPLQMVIVSTIIAITVNMSSLFLANFIDIPITPVIVVLYAMLILLFVFGSVCFKKFSKSHIIKTLER